MASASAGSTMPWFGEHGDMGQRAGDVLGGELAVEVDGGVDLLHDLGRAGGEPAAPHLVAHARQALVSNDDENEKRTRRAAVSYWRRRARRRRGGARRPLRDGRAAPARREPTAPPPRARSPPRWRRSPRAKSPRSNVAARAAARRALAFEGAGRRQADARRFRGQGACCSTSGRPGACPAGPKCRRSTGCRRRRAGRDFEVVAVNVDTARLERAAGIPRSRSASRRSPATPIRAATRSRPCAWPARRSACRRA